MKVIRFDNGACANRREYVTDITDIRAAAAEFGRSEDTLELWTDNGSLVGAATWPQGSKVYKYCTGENLDPNPEWRVFVY